MDTDLRPSPLAMAVLSLLHAGPLHPYAMQGLIKQWGKDQVINVGQRANLYKTIRRLQDAGLVAVRQTERDQNYPERTVYELTEAGREAALRVDHRDGRYTAERVPPVPRRTVVRHAPRPAAGADRRWRGGRPDSKRGWPRSRPTSRSTRARCPG